MVETKITNNTNPDIIAAKAPVAIVSILSLVSVDILSILMILINKPNCSLIYDYSIYYSFLFIKFYMRCNNNH